VFEQAAVRSYLDERGAGVEPELVAPELQQVDPSPARLVDGHDLAVQHYRVLVGKGGQLGEFGVGASHVVAVAADHVHPIGPDRGHRPHTSPLELRPGPA
jgi:hypothetical protein